jgi:mycofactocin biosynthetic radical S-adenosylmethionine protein MftC
METSLAKLLSKAVRSHHPCYASFELTYACNLSCAFCYNPVARKEQVRETPPPAPHSPPLSFDEILALLDQLKDMGVLYLTLTGGEPMVHPRFWDVAYAAKERNFALRIFTNGTLIDEAVADRLADLRPFCLEVSVHGAREETALALHRTPGAFEALLKALDFLQERNLRVYLKCIVTKLVEDELEEIKALGARFGFPAYFDPVLTLSDDGLTYPLELAASDEGLYRMYKSKSLDIGNSPFQREPGQYNCNVGTGTLHVDPYGSVQPCVQWKQSIGNLREMPLREIWENSPLLESVRKACLAVPAMLQEKVEEHAYCMHCPGLSLLRTGDPLQPEPQYLRQARIRKRVAKEEGSR